MRRPTVTAREVKKKLAAAFAGYVRMVDAATSDGIHAMGEENSDAIERSHRRGIRLFYKAMNVM